MVCQHFEEKCSVDAGEEVDLPAFNEWSIDDFRAILLAANMTLTFRRFVSASPVIFRIHYIALAPNSSLVLYAEDQPVVQFVVQLFTNLGHFQIPNVGQ